MFRASKSNYDGLRTHENETMVIAGKTLFLQMSLEARNLVFPRQLDARRPKCAKPTPTAKVESVTRRERVA